MVLDNDLALFFFALFLIMNSNVNISTYIRIWIYRHFNSVKSYVDPISCIEWNPFVFFTFPFSLFPHQADQLLDM